MRQAWVSRVGMVTLVGGLWFGGVGLGISPAEAAPGGGKTDLTTNLHVIDSSSPPVVVGEVVGFQMLGFDSISVFVALSPALANADPPLVMWFRFCYPPSNPNGCVSPIGTAFLYYTDAACTTTPYFTVPVTLFTPTHMIATSIGATTSYQIYKPGTGDSSTQILFSSFRDPTSTSGACSTADYQTNFAVQADPTPYSITLTPPFKMKNP